MNRRNSHVHTTLFYKGNILRTVFTSYSADKNIQDLLQSRGKGYNPPT
jgi:hypothetical protein